MTITLTAGNLPARSPVTVTWSTFRRGSPLTLAILTGPRGNLRTGFSVPAAPLGSYRITLAAHGVLLAHSTYLVVSSASIRAAVNPDPHGDSVAVTGVKFLARTQLLLVAYPLPTGRHPIVLGSTRTDGSGRCSFRTVTSKLAPGEYSLRAFTVGGLVSQIAETYFQVTI
jgi:hypothetical protein